MPCAPNTSDHQILITDHSTYQATFQDLSTGEINCALPTVNFTEESLLGFYGSGQCHVKFKRDVTRDEDNRKYIYQLKVASCGAYIILEASYNWVTVPKLPADWTVTYDIK